MTATDAEVAAVMEALGCRRAGPGDKFCAEHNIFGAPSRWTDRGCPVAAAAADAAIAAARPRIEAEALREVAPLIPDEMHASVIRRALRTRADRIEARDA